MRIAVDAREMEKDATGVGCFLLQVLKKRDPATWDRHEIFLYFKTSVPDELFLKEAPFRKKVIAHPLLKQDLIWEQIMLPYHLWKDRIQIFWGVGGACSAVRLGWKNVVNVYDLTFFMDPRWFPWREKMVRRLRAFISAARGNFFITLSDSTKNDLMRFLGVPETKVRRVFPGADHTGPSEEKPLSAKHSGGILFVGSILNRRPLPCLIKALALLRYRYPFLTLTIIGDNRTHPRRDLSVLVHELGLEGRVIVRGYVPDKEIQKAYTEGALFCFPSFYEGFGFPILEAQRYGLPVLLLDNSSMREVAGDSAHYSRSHDPAHLADGIERLLTDAEYSGTLRHKGWLNSQKFRWETASRAILDVVTA